MTVYECNKGGDRMELNHMGKGIWEFKIAHSCVWTLQLRGTIQEISKSLYNLIMKIEK